MKKLFLSVFCLGVMFLASAALADYSIVTPPISPAINYGVWFDRDGVGAGQPSYHSDTHGRYDIDIIYHAYDANTAVMWATINGIPQGYDANGDQAVDTVYGLSFESAFLNNMHPFWSQTGDRTYAGTTAVSGLTVVGTQLGSVTPSSKSYGAFSLDKNSTSAAWHGDPLDSWDLTAGDLVFSYTIDLSGIVGNANMIVYFLGMKGPIGNPPTANAGWLGNVVLAGQIPNDSLLNLNDKFDLQNLRDAGEGSYNVVGGSPVPEPATMLLLGLGLMGIAGIRRKFKG